MSIHKSLRIKSQLLRARNVWTRLERIQKLEEDGRFAQDQSIFGLPKVRTRFKVKTIKPAAAAKESTEGTEAAEGDVKSESGA